MRIARWSLRAGFVGLTSLVCVLWASAGPALSPDTDRVGADEGTVTYSFFPSTYTPGSPVQVRLTANQYSWGTRVRVEDRFPVGWTASGATPPATQTGNKLVWDLPLAGKKATTVSYNATPPAGASGIATFHHLVIFSSDSTSQQTDGDRLIAAAGGGCTLTCSAAASTAAGTAPLAVVFVGSAAPSGCSGSVAYDWDFGDGSAHASIASPSHTYTDAGHLHLVHDRHHRGGELHPQRHRERRRRVLAGVHGHRAVHRSGGVVRRVPGHGHPRQLHEHHPGVAVDLR